MPSVNVWMSAELHALAKEHGLSPSKVLRVAMEHTLAHLEEGAASNRTIAAIVASNPVTRNGPPPE